MQFWKIVLNLKVKGSAIFKINVLIYIIIAIN